MKTVKKNIAIATPEGEIITMQVGDESILFSSLEGGHEVWRWDCVSECFLLHETDGLIQSRDQDFVDFVNQVATEAYNEAT